jgi:hypothetical protein
MGTHNLTQVKPMLHRTLDTAPPDIVTILSKRSLYTPRVRC